MSHPTDKLPPSVKPLLDAASCHWLEQRVRPSIRGEAHLYSMMPDGFESYARILHPAYWQGSDVPLRWAEVAAQAGTVLHPGAHYEKLAGSNTGHLVDPLQGRLPEAEARVLVSILGNFTESNDCGLLIWEGYASMKEIQKEAATIRLPRRVYRLYGGTLDSVLELLDEGQPIDGPNLWWPEDQAWCCATDIDDFSTYVGGSRPCIGEILASCLETFGISSDARIDRQADTINPEVPT